MSDILKRGDNKHVNKGRIPSLTEDDLEDIRKWIVDCIEDKDPLTLGDVVAILQEEKHKMVTVNAVQKALKRSGIAKTITAHPEEAGRLSLKYEEVARYTNEATTLLNNIPAAFVFNMDETGIDDVANAKPKKVLVPFGSNETCMKYPVSPNGDHITLVACIAANGSATVPLVVMTDLTIRERIYEEGWTPTEVMFANTTSGYINQTVFNRWVTNVFIPDVEARREKFNMPEQQAFLVMDGCSAHKDEEVKRDLEAHNITVIFIPAHGSHLFQPLDRVAFSSFKANVRSAVPADSERQTARLLKILESWEKTTTKRIIKESFTLAGFRYAVHGDKQLVTFDLNAVNLPIGMTLPTADPPRPVRANPRRARPRKSSGRRVRYE